MGRESCQPVKPKAEREREVGPSAQCAHARRGGGGGVGGVATATSLGCERAMQRKKERKKERTKERQIETKTERERERERQREIDSLEFWVEGLRRL